jgi:ABC-2 type transport system permease protein
MRRYVNLRNVGAIFRRELGGYFTTPVAYVFLIVFLALAGAMTFYIGQFFERNQADLDSFFTFHPWLYLFLIPAIAMRLWAEERKSGTVELLLTMPLSLWDAVLGKFLAAWVFAGIALVLTFPMWLTVNYLACQATLAIDGGVGGIAACLLDSLFSSNPTKPDNGAALAGYLGSFLMAGAYLAIGSCLSAATKNQVIAFVLAAVICFLFTLGGSTLVTGFLGGFLPQIAVDLIASMSFLGHFDQIKKGVIDLRDVVFFASMIGVFLFATTLVLDLKKGQ